MNRRYPPRPLVGVGAIVLDGPQVLLVRRGREPQRGYWSLPGGLLELGERLTEAVEREVREEAGLEIDVGEIVEVFERITTDGAGQVEYHYVLVDYLCEPAGGTLAAADDAAEAAWVERSRLAELEMTSGTLPVIEKAFALRDARTSPAPVP